MKDSVTENWTLFTPASSGLAGVLATGGTLSALHCCLIYRFQRAESIMVPPHPGVLGRADFAGYLAGQG